MGQEEIIVYRFGALESSEQSSIVFNSHFKHLKENRTLLFTTSSRIATENNSGRKIIFVNEDKSKSFEAVIVKCGNFAKNEFPNNYDEFNVPEEFQPSLDDEIQKGYRWFAVKTDEENLTCKKFSKGLYRLSRTDVFDSLGENQTPFRYVVSKD